VAKPLLVALLVVVFAFQARSDDPWGDSEFVFARVRFNMSIWAVLDGINQEGQPPWQHDQPFSEHFYLGILREVTSLETNDAAQTVVDLSSEEIFEFPFLYISEPGFMELSDREVAHLGEYLRRGGFIMFDDFRGADLTVLQRYLGQAFPERAMFRLDVSHPIFDAFYTIDSLDFVPPYLRADASGPPEFWGLEDETGRLMVVANQNNDIGEFWEALDLAEQPLQPAADSVRLGINYMIYAMTH
jgi:hypothetical protein